MFCINFIFCSFLFIFQTSFSNTSIPSSNPQNVRIQIAPLHMTILHNHIKNKQSKQYSIADKCVENELYFLDALISEDVQQLIKDINNPDLFIAESAFTVLKILWPWKRQYTFLIPNLDDNTESDFIMKLCIDIMKIVERDYITRPDYITKYTDIQSFDIIQKYKEQCIQLQKKGNLEDLLNEVNYLRHRVTKNGKKNNLTDNICLAIAEKISLDPVTTLLHEIAHAPSLEEAHYALQTLEKLVLNQAKKANII